MRIKTSRLIESNVNGRGVLTTPGKSRKKKIRNKERGKLRPHRFGSETSMRAEARPTTYDDDDDDDDSDDGVGSSPRRSTCGLDAHWTAVEDRFLSVVDCISYQKRKIKNFVLSILGPRSTLPRTVSQ